MPDMNGGYDHAQAEARIHDRLRSLALEATAILREDIPLFFEREARRRFVEAPPFAEAMTEERLKELKATLVRAGREAAEEATAGLRELEPWLAGHVQHEAATAGLEDNPTLWAIVTNSCARLGDILGSHDFPSDDPEGSYEVDYQAPRRFVSGLYMPTIAEKYWRSMADLKALDARRHRVETESQRTRLGKRWDST